MRKRLIEALVSRVDMMEGSPIVRGRGGPAKTPGETIRKDLDLSSVSENLVLTKPSCVV